MVGLAPAADFGFLLGDGEILRVSAGVTQVGSDGRTRGKGVIGHRSTSFRILYSPSFPDSSTVQKNFDLIIAPKLFWASTYIFTS